MLTLLLLALIGPTNTEQDRFDRAVKDDIGVGYKLLVATDRGDELIKSIDTWEVKGGVLSVGRELSGVKLKSITLIDDEGYSVCTRRKPARAGLSIRRDDCKPEPATRFFIEGCGHGRWCPEDYHFTYVACANP